MTARGRAVATAALVLALAIHAAPKVAPGRLPEMLWACHVATAAMAAGVALDLHRVVAAALIFHVGMGLPAFLVDAVANRATSLTSVVAHLVPLVVGALAVRPGGVPRGSVRAAWAFWLVMQAVSFAFTPAHLNVNLVHAPWPPLAGAVPTWASILANAVLALGFLAAAGAAVRCSRAR